MLQHSGFEEAHVRTGAMLAIIGLQGFQVGFLLLHDWVPLGRFNDITAQRTTDPLGKRLLITLLSAAPFLAGLVFSLSFASHFRVGWSWPAWVWSWLRVSYGLLLVGELRAWWVPYLVRPDPVRAQRYRQLFGRTHSCLPERNGVIPNTLHVVLHAATLTTVLLLWASR